MIKNVLIIAEGYEEKMYLDKILSFPNIRKDIYNFKAVINSKGSGNIKARFQYALQNGYYDAVLVFCDVDCMSESFLHLFDDIGEFFENKEDAIKVFIFANPVTLEIVLSHFGEANITYSGKKTNAPIVETLTGIKNYSAKEEQIKEMIGLIHYDSLDDFKERLSNISTNIRDVPSTNFLLFLERFENDNVDWVEEIQKAIKK